MRYPPIWTVPAPPTGEVVDDEAVAVPVEGTAPPAVESVPFALEDFPVYFVVKTPLPLVHSADVDELLLANVISAHWILGQINMTNGGSLTTSGNGGSHCIDRHLGLHSSRLEWLHCHPL